MTRRTTRIQHTTAKMSLKHHPPCPCVTCVTLHLIQGGHEDISKEVTNRFDSGLNAFHLQLAESSKDVFRDCVSDG